MRLKKEFTFKLVSQILFFFVIFLNIYANEVRIVAKIENDIITNIDIENEYKYLITLNNSLKDIEKKQLLLFAKNSLIKEKIKKNEIKKFYELDKKNDAVDKLITGIYKKLNINSLNEFKIYLQNNELEYSNVYKKLEIEAVWNEMVYYLFKDKIYIDEADLKNKLINNQQKVESLLISEIIVNITNKNDVEKVYNRLQQSIEKFGYKETVLKLSIANSKNNSGLLGWINKNTLSKKIQNELSKIEIGQITRPILISSGMLVLKLEDKKFVESTQNLDEQLLKLKNFEINNQLNNFSTIHYNKIKKNFLINE